MSQHALSDQQVNNELSKMTAFIKQEAMEKAREIEIKANEEFEIEKSKLVRQETDAIDTQYEKKFKQATMSQQITRSTVSNKTRLKVLGARQEMLDNIFEEAQKKLAEGAKDKGKYQKALKGLLLEGFYALNEPELQVRSRKKDYDIVKKAIEEAAKEYKKELGKDITAKIQEDDPLPEGMYFHSAGGVSIISGSGKIDIDNTFEARLRLLEESAAPAVREALFGKNPNRKFTD
ncbi:ATPase V1/A1 complex subunit E [Fusarium acuminatum]|uniref:ATPase V1/A1 complex subunit E n=1 Tax=Fusarium acuminatum TaxID=5515 RepID=A0ABZ2X7X8_9HYPO